MKHNILKIALSAVSFSGLALAGSVTYSVTVPGVGSTPLVDIHGVTLATSLPQFDPSLGTLTSADINTTVNYTQDFTFGNTGGTSQFINLNTGTEGFVNGPGATVTTFNTGYVNGTLNYTSYLLLPGHSIELTTAGTVTADRHISTDPSDPYSSYLRNGYVGTGQVDFTIVEANHAIYYDPTVTFNPNTGARPESITPPAGIVQSLQGTAVLSLAITYNFDDPAPVGGSDTPEPATYAAGGLGLVLVAIGRIRRVK